MPWSEWRAPSSTTWTSPDVPAPQSVTEGTLLKTAELVVPARPVPDAG